VERGEGRGWRKRRKCDRLEGEEEGVEAGERGGRGIGWRDRGKGGRLN
jgi:hypothetical protein